MSATPFFLQSSRSESLMAREASLMSGVSGPTPEQNSLKPPPVPVDSTTGVLNFPPLPSASATVVANGYTVDDPVTWTLSRATAAAAASEASTVADSNTADRVREWRMGGTRRWGKVAR